MKNKKEILKEIRIQRQIDRLSPEVDFYDIWPKEWEISIWRKKILDFFYILKCRIKK